MKKYTLEAVIRGQNVKFAKKFDSRDSAINYIFDYYNKRYMYDLMVNEEFAINGNKHNIEYVCDQGNRFRISRVTL